MARLHSTLLAGATAAALFLSGCANYRADLNRDTTPRTDLTPLKPVAKTVRIAPDFTFHGASVKSLRALRGQAVVLIITDSPKTGAFKKQLKNLAPYYGEFASRQVVFIAAFRKDDGGESVKSNIPFAIANNPTAVSNAFNAEEDMTIVIIGKDGNVDYQTSKKLPGGRVRDVIQNSYQVQATTRK